MRDNFPHLDYIGVALGLASWLLPSIPWQLKIIIAIIVIFGAYSLRNKVNNPDQTPHKNPPKIYNLRYLASFAIIVFIFLSPILISFLFLPFAEILQIKQIYFKAPTELTNLVTEYGDKITLAHGLVVAMPLAIYGFVYGSKTSRETRKRSGILVALGYQFFLVLLFYNAPFFFSDSLPFRLGVIFHPFTLVALDLSSNSLLCNFIYIIEIGMVLILDWLYVSIGVRIADSFKPRTLYQKYSDYIRKIIQ